MYLRFAYCILRNSLTVVGARAFCVLRLRLRFVFLVFALSVGMIEFCVLRLRFAFCLRRCVCVLRVAFAFCV